MPTGDPLVISPWEGALHNHRHSGESRNPEGLGKGKAHVI